MALTKKRDSVRVVSTYVEAADVPKAELPFHRHIRAEGRSFS